MAVSACFEVHSGLFPALVLNFVADLLSLIETVQSGAFDCGDVNEHVLSAAVWLYEAKALGRVEKLYDALSGHLSNFLSW